MSAKCLEILGNKAEENGDILLDYVYFFQIFLKDIFNTSANEHLTVLFVVVGPHTFLWEVL